MYYVRLLEYVPQFTTDVLSKTIQTRKRKNYLICEFCEDYVSLSFRLTKFWKKVLFCFKEFGNKKGEPYIRVRYTPGNIHIFKNINLVVALQD